MAIKHPLVLNGGRTRELAATDTLPATSLPVMVGATLVADGEVGAVPKPLVGGPARYLSGGGTWDLLTPLAKPDFTILQAEWPGDVIQYDGNQWRNAPLPVGSPGSAGSVTLYCASPTITGTSGNNVLPVHSLSKTPVTTGELTVSGSANNSGVPLVAWLSESLGVDTLPAGLWTTVFFAGVDTVADERLTWINRRVFEVIPEGMTLGTTGTGTSRTATSASGAPFVSGDADAGMETANWLQTPQGLYQITGFTSGTVVTIAVPAGYANETGAAWSKWRGLFVTSSLAITSITPTALQQTWDATQGTFAVATTSQLGIMDLLANSGGATTGTLTYNGDTGTTRHSRLHTTIGSGQATALSTGALINGATALTSPADGDQLAITDSTAAHLLKKLTWANLKAALKTYLDGLYGRTVLLTASENLAAFDLVNVWNNSGPKVRKADATAAGKEAAGFVLAAATSGNSAEVYLSGPLTGLAGLTPGGRYYLSATTPGAITATPPTGTGAVVQFVGLATTTSALAFTPDGGTILS